MSFFKKFTLVQKKETDLFIKLLREKQSITSLWLPGLGRTATIQMFSKGEKFHKEYPELGEEYEFITLDMSINGDYFDKQLREVLRIQSNDQNIRERISKIAETKTVVFMLDNFNFSDIDKVKYVYSLSNGEIGRVLFWIFALDKDFITDSTVEGIETTFIHNLVRIPYLTEDESIEWLSKNQHRHFVTLTKNQKESIAKFSGGIPAILRCHLRILQKNEVIEGNEEIEVVANNLWIRYSEKEREVIRRLKLTNTLPPYHREISYLKEHNLIKSNGELNGEWFDLVVRKDENIEFVIKDGLIQWEKINIEEALTKNEMAILKTLVAKPDEVLNREEIAKAVWGENAYSEYSDWAIDQMVSRLRKKIDEIGIDSKIIKTVRGKGYKLQNVSIQNED